jgi:hypothetical protein
MRGGRHALAGDDRRAARQLKIAAHGCCRAVTLFVIGTVANKERRDDTDACPGP